MQENIHGTLLGQMGRGPVDASDDGPDPLLIHHADDAGGTTAPGILVPVLHQAKWPPSVAPGRVGFFDGELRSLPDGTTDGVIGVVRPEVADANFAKVAGNLLRAAPLRCHP